MTRGDDLLSTEEHLRRITARLRAQAASLPVGETIDAGAGPGPTETADGVGEAALARADPPPHWQEEAEEKSQAARGTQDDPGRGSNPL